jgi:hypothetical protein
MGNAYHIGYWITWVLVFLAVWIGCSLQYGFMGFALAWMPAAIIATVIAFLWPLILLGGIVIVLKLWN